MINEIKIFNTLDRKKVLFEPIDCQNVRVYACGPTVYSYAHIGNARMAVVCDLLIRALRFKYEKVTYTSNITDIDDKIISAARKENVTIDKITEKFLKIYNSDMSILGVNKPDLQPKATEHINDMINLIQKLIKNNNAYVAKKHVLFHVPSYEFYGCLSKRSKDEQISGSRVEVAPFKKYSGDFVLWKPSIKDEPGWESPWGFGRPGWHLECSAMSEYCLGLPFDIHAGGIDLTFPHHENEIAQSCSITPDKKPQSFAKYWFHNGFVLSGGEKMSKSLGNIKLVNELTKTYPGETIRLALLSSHYRQPLNWTNDILKQSQNMLNKFYRVLKNHEHDENSLMTKELISEDLINAIFDDLNTPKALAVLNKLISQYQLADHKEKKKLRLIIINSGTFLGFLNANPSEWLGFKKSADMEDTKYIEELILKRNEARKKKDFTSADNIREKLKQMGIEIEDLNSETQWRKVEKD